MPGSSAARLMQLRRLAADVGATSRVPRPMQRRDRGERGRHQPRGRVAVVAAHDLAERGPEREPAVHRNRPVAHRFAPPVGGREVGDHRGGTDEERRLADAGDDPGPDEPPQLGDEPVARGRHRDDHRAADDQHPPAELVADPARERPQRDRTERERTDCHADRDLAEPELVLDVVRDDRCEHRQPEEVARPHVTTSTNCFVSSDRASRPGSSRA